MATQAFPLDSATLLLLRAACEINPDTGRTHLHDFLSMGERVKSATLLDAEGPFGHPIYEVEFEDGYAPFSEHSVISTLATEVLRLRGEE
jgi:hypothetical protein